MVFAEDPMRNGWFQMSTQPSTIEVLIVIYVLMVFAVFIAAYIYFRDRYRQKNQKISDIRSFVSSLYYYIGEVGYLKLVHVSTGNFIELCKFSLDGESKVKIRIPGYCLSNDNYLSSVFSLYKEKDISFSFYRDRSLLIDEYLEALVGFAEAEGVDRLTDIIKEILCILEVSEDDYIEIVFSGEFDHAATRKYLEKVIRNNMSHNDSALKRYVDNKIVNKN